MLIGTARGGSGGVEGKTPIRDESSNNPTPIISGFEEELLINGMVDYVLVLKLDVQKSNWSTVMIFPWCGKEMVQKIAHGTTFMA